MHIKAVIIDVGGGEREIRVGRRYRVGAMNIYHGCKWCSITEFVEGKQLAAMARTDAGHDVLIAIEALEPLSALEQLAEEAGE